MGTQGTAVVSVDPLLLNLLASRPTEPEVDEFFGVDPVFLIPLASGPRLRQLATGQVRIHTA